MSTVLKKHNALMEWVVREYGPMISGAVDKALRGLPGAEDVVSEVHFAVFATLRKLGDGWVPPRSFVSKVVNNQLNDLLWQRCWEREDLEAFKNHQTEQALQREEMIARVCGQIGHSPSCFRVFRLRMVYPVYGFQIVVAFNKPWKPQ